MSDAWYRDAFQSDYLNVYLQRDLSEAARAVRFLTQALSLNRDHALLDVCCGPGRHLAFIRPQVRLAVGIDLSRDLLIRAREHVMAVAQTQPKVAKKTFPAILRGDMRRLPLRAGAFDRLINWFTSFGYFETEEENNQALREMARVLRPGGLMAIDHMNFERQIHVMQAHSEKLLADGRRVYEERRFDKAGMRIIKQVTIEASGVLPEQSSAESIKKTRTPPLDSHHAHSWRESVRIYMPETLEAMLIELGLKPLRRVGDYDGGAWHEQAPRLIIIAVKN